MSGSLARRGLCAGALLPTAACGPVPGGWALASWWPVQSWAAIWLEHPDVRVRLGDALYELTAVPVTDPERRTAVLNFRGYDPVPGGIVLFRFDARAGGTS